MNTLLAAVGWSGWCCALPSLAIAIFCTAVGAVGLLVCHKDDRPLAAIALAVGVAILAAFGIVRYLL